MKRERCDKAPITETERKARWRRKQGPEYAKKRNEITKEYMKTFRGHMAKRVGAINRGAKFRGSIGRLSGVDLIAIWKAQGGVTEKGQIIQEPSCRMCGATLDTMARRGFICDHIVPIMQPHNGPTERANIQLLCDNCNLAKSSTERESKSVWNQGKPLRNDGAVVIDPQLRLFI